MENVYRIKSGDLINIKEKFAEYTNQLCPTRIQQLPQTYEDVKNILDIQSGAEEELLEDSISLNNLAQADDIPIFDVNLHDMHTKQGRNTVEIPSKAMRLKCVRHRVEVDASKNRVNASKKYNRYRYIEHKTNDTDDQSDLKPFQDIIITVRVYEPFVYKRGEGTQRKPHLSQEFFVLGRQTLTEFRDKIYCYCKFGPFNDISNDFESIEKPVVEQLQNTSVDVIDSGFFFITDTFYNDNRVSNIDYSMEIREWIARQKDFGSFHVKSMDDMKFEDLYVRVGFPQLYRHYCNCEHIISFTDIRLLAPDDPQKSSDYPILRCISSSKMTLCNICGIIEATFVVKNSDNHIQDPSFLCRNCFISFHYIDGEKVGNFQAFRYYGNRPIIH